MLRLMKVLPLVIGLTSFGTPSVLIVVCRLSKLGDGAAGRRTFMPTLSTVEGHTPDSFAKIWADMWQQGQHVTMLGMTGSGKTTCERFLLSPCDFVIVPDAKAGDDNLDNFGYRRVGRWPLPLDMRHALKNKEPVHVILGKVAKTKRVKEANTEMLRRAVGDLWEQGGWTVACDELQLLASKRFAGGEVGDDIEELLISARFRKISVVSVFQRPSIGRDTPAASAAISQSEYVFVSTTRDQSVHDRLAEICGRPKPEMRGLIGSLPKYYWACFSLDPTEPVRIFLPPKLKAVAKTQDNTPVGRLEQGGSRFWGEKVA
jgi:hypothetical protein